MPTGRTLDFLVAGSSRHEDHFALDLHHRGIASMAITQAASNPIIGRPRNRLSNGRTEGLNSKARTLTRRAYGFHSAHGLIALLMLCCSGIHLDPVHVRPGIVAERLGRGARSGALFVFFGRKRTALKVLFFDGTGMCVFYKPTSIAGRDHLREVTEIRRGISDRLSKRLFGVARSRFSFDSSDCAVALFLIAVMPMTFAARAIAGVRLPG